MLLPSGRSSNEARSTSNTSHNNLSIATAAANAEHSPIYAQTTKPKTTNGSIKENYYVLENNLTTTNEQQQQQHQQNRTVQFMENEYQQNTSGHQQQQLQQQLQQTSLQYHPYQVGQHYEQHHESNHHQSYGLTNASLPLIGEVKNLNISELTLEEFERNLKEIQQQLKEGWTVHLGNNGRLYYCNHVMQTAGWLPSLEDWCKTEDLPYGWERAVDSKGRSYYINHLTKTSTYEAPDRVKWDEKKPEPRLVTLQRNPPLGFGFVAGSEKPVVVRFVTEGGPSIDKLQPGDQILAVNGEDVKEAPREHVIQLVRACENEVTLLVCQPALVFAPGRKSTLLSAGKRAKLRTRPNRVRFAESVCVNGAPLFPPSAFSLSDICVPPMANVLKVFLENGQTKSFKYDASTTVQDVMTSLLDKLCLKSGEIFSLVLEHVKSLKRNKFTLLDPEETLAHIAARPGAHKLRCLFRVVFVPSSAADLAQRDLNALDYLYTQCCNDVAQERFAPELQPEVALRLATLHIHQHALDNNFSPNKLNVKVIEREFGLERFVPASLYENMKRKELRRLLTHFLKLNAEMTGSSSKQLTQLQAKLHYLDIIASLPSYGAKCFSTNQKVGVERVLLIGPRFGLSQILSARNAAPQAITALEDITHIIVNREDDVSCSVCVYMQNDRVVRFSMEDRDANEFSLVVAGYHRLLTGKVLTVMREREPLVEDNSPSYLSQHTVLPALWSYLQLYHDRVQSINFLTPPPYHCLQDNHAVKCDSNMNSSNVANSNHSSPKIITNNMSSMDLDIHSVVATELLEEAKDSGISDSSGTGSYYFDQPQYMEHRNFVETKNEAVLRRVQEMQMMVKNSEQYLNEQGDLIRDNNEQRLSQDKFTTNGNFWLNAERNNSSNNKSGTIEFDSDCESLNSSKISSNEESTEQCNTALKHSDSLTLLAESINQDVNALAANNENDQQVPTPLSLISSPRADRKIRGFTKILSDLQALGTDYSQSESDAESMMSPTSSPTSQRPLNSNGFEQRQQQNKMYRGSFGIHSPDDTSYNANRVSFNLNEYLEKLGDLNGDAQSKQPLSEESKKKLSTLYTENLIETDTDLIDLRAIPPPQTPDDLDSFSIFNAPPKEFDDILNKEHLAADEVDGELEQFLKNVVVAPPTQKATPAKELTPEEIMSYIIPPPPETDTAESTSKSHYGNQMESLYSNSSNLNRSFDTTVLGKEQREQPTTTTASSASLGHIIEYATVDRKNKFSCCPKVKKDSVDVDETGNVVEYSTLKLPPRQQQTSEKNLPPARPPKSVELIQRFSPKKQLQFPPPRDTSAYERSSSNNNMNMEPPVLPPRPSLGQNNVEASSRINTVSVPPKKPFQEPIAAARPMHLRILPTQPTGFPQSSPLTLPQPNYSQPLRPSNFQKKPPLLYQHSTQLSPNERGSNEATPSPQPRPIIVRNGHVIDGEALLAKTDVAMAGLLVKLDQVAQECTAAQSAGGGSSIDEEKFQRARNELTEQTLVLVTASKFLVVAMTDMTLFTLPEHLTSCLTALRRITELTQDMTRHTSSPLQTRNIVLKVHDVASHFRELVQVRIGPLGAGKLALQAECLANVLATLLRSLRVFSP